MPVEERQVEFKPLSLMIEGWVATMLAYAPFSSDGDAFRSIASKMDRVADLLRDGLLDPVLVAYITEHDRYVGHLRIPKFPDAPLQVSPPAEPGAEEGDTLRLFPDPK